MTGTLGVMSVRLTGDGGLDSLVDVGQPCLMADELEPQLPRGGTVSRREGAPPWRVDVDARRASIHVVVRGSFYLAEDEHRALPLGAGDIVLVGAGDPRGAPRSTAVAPARLQCVAGPAPAELISATYPPLAAPDPRLAAGAPPVHLTAVEVQREPGLLSIVSLLRAALAEPSAARERLSRSLLEPLLAYVLHCHDRVSAGGLGARPADSRVARALRIMESRLAERWTVESLAKAAGLSRAAFARRFLSEVGVPPLRRLADLRMERAARLLAEGDDGLASIADQVGYDSAFAFSRAFKRRTGEAPIVYRHRHRAEGFARRPAISPAPRPAIVLERRPAIAAPLRPPPIRAAA